MSDHILRKFNLAGKVAVVTGASRGIGRAIAEAFAAAGADVVGVSRSDMSETDKMVRLYGRSFTPLRADLANEDEVVRVAEEILDRVPRIHILVNNAGLIRRADALQYRLADWDLIQAVNLRHVFLLSQLFARHFIDCGGGKIINIASLLSFQGGIYVPAYSASKAGVLALTKALANEWAKYKVNVNAIAPGYIATEATSALREDESRNREILGRIPAGRWGTPEDVQGAAVFLASDAADYMHGSVVVVDGGWLAR